MSVVYCASNLGGPERRVLARFISDDRGLHTERFDRQAGRWVHDGRVAGFLTGQDDWAERITEREARRIMTSWGLSPALLSGPVTEAATT